MNLIEIFLLSALGGLTYLAREKIINFLGLVWTFTGGAWVRTFFYRSDSSTGNGSGAMGSLIDLLMMFIHIVLIIIGIIVYVIYHFCH